ncbi:hypothetical protein NQ315_016950 [Exocentrus adspersus]|uniref:Very-long-chain (3R)-3-hydroxyacyl-CoA dehydratase n=1 Tax=Exocentrus adspersus TaxID=1586481 RepID=A0AAV8VXQ6_9CUCU|nr:hypothetical protein NQ315_016950 [Exocentrus adspersus]
MTVLSPFVYWAQNEHSLFLKIDLKDVKQPQVVLEKKKLQFNSKGSGAQGFKDYTFLIDFHSEIDESKNQVKITDHKVDLTLTKIEKGWWPRLTSQPQKPVWLKVDFDRWQSEDDLIEEDVRDIREDYPDLYDRLQKEEMGYRKEDFRKVYLSLYNLFMFCGFLYVTVVLCIRYVRDGQQFLPHAYETVGSVLCCLQLLQLLEVLHPIFGYVKGGAFMPFVQIGGRCFVLILMIEHEPRIQKMPVVFYLFLVWCGIEIIRYPYYMSQLHEKENGLLTWLRYSAWMVLYPIGFVCEGIIVFRNLIYVDQSNKWSVSLPNPLNFTFHFATLLRLYMLFVMMPGMYVLMSHMFKVRKQKLGGKKVRRIKKS